MDTSAVSPGQTSEKSRWSETVSVADSAMKEDRKYRWMFTIVIIRSIGMRIAWTILQLFAGTATTLSLQKFLISKYEYVTFQTYFISFLVKEKDE